MNFCHQHNSCSTRSVKPNIPVWMWLISGVLFLLMTSTTVEARADTLNQPFELSAQKQTWETVFGELGKRIPIVAAIPDEETAPILPEGNRTLLTFVEELATQNNMEWSLRQTQEAQTVLVLSRPCIEGQHISTHMAESGGLLWSETYALVRFLDALPSDQLRALTAGPMKVGQIPNVAKPQLSDLGAYLDSSQREYLLQKSHGDVESTEQKLLGVRIIPMVEVEIPAQLPRFSLLPWTAFTYKDVSKTTDGTLIWAGDKEQNKSNNVIVEQPLAPLLLDSTFKENAPVKIESSGWQALLQILEPKAQEEKKQSKVQQQSRKFIVNQAVGNPRVWVSEGTYSRGILRQLALRSLCMEVRPLSEVDSDTFLVDVLRLPAVQENKRFRERRLQVVKRLLPLWQPWIEQRLQEEKLPFRSEDMWIENKAFSTFTPEQQLAVARRWLEVTRIYRTLNQLPLGDFEKMTPEIATKQLRQMNAQVSVQPSLLFTTGLYKPEKDGENFECIWEAQLPL